MTLVMGAFEIDPTVALTFFNTIPTVVYIEMKNTTKDQKSVSKD
jgi:hypothetical protein